MERYFDISSKIDDQRREIIKCANAQVWTWVTGGILESIIILGISLNVDENNSQQVKQGIINFGIFSGIPIIFIHGYLEYVKTKAGLKILKLQERMVNDTIVKSESDVLPNVTKDKFDNTILRHLPKVSTHEPLGYNTEVIQI